MTRTTSEPDPSKLTEAALSEAALSYLNRYDATVHQLRQVLRRRIARYASPEEAPEVERRIENVLERFVASKLLCDQRFAEGFVRAARQRGLSALRIGQKLRQRGLDPELVSAALAQLVTTDDLDDLAAAHAYVRKKRLLKRYDLSVATEKQKALASLARQGFSFRTALDALDAARRAEAEREEPDHEEPDHEPDVF